MQPTAPPDDPSWSVIARAAAGDPDARSKFASACLPVIRGFLELRWRGSPLANEVEDAVQDVFVECLRQDGVLARADPSRGELRGLLYGVACNVARRCEVSATKHDATASALADLPAREKNLSVQFDRLWALAMVRAAGELMRARAERGSAEERRAVELLHLRFADGLPIREIAVRWNVEPESVHRSYRKAREAFRACLRSVLGELSLRGGAVHDEDLERILELLGE